MQGIIGSASKIAFLVLTLAACAGFFVGRLGENNFMILAGAAFAFYFSHKGEAGAPFAGK